ncbi:sugar dehydrogenase complex small subunit [Bradyrhizobium erythrophlei]|uniref:sugar dehydrogenase complex small subunit n=1 Tax=Bradyrhizobium erythrophlei TaxID=1437360 RepID=UPI0035EDAF84
MSTSIDRTPARHDDDRSPHLTRRTVLAGAAATTAAVTLGGEPAAALDLFSADMVAFNNLSSALTGIHVEKLAPVTDALDLKRDYFDWVMKQQRESFMALLQIAKANAATPQAIIDKSQASDDTRYLARSIVLMWYLGAWYEPADLKRLVDARKDAKPAFVPFTVISPKAYTQGWLWRVIQAHPMGYSDMQFGYWTRPPEPLEDFISRTAIKGT